MVTSATARAAVPAPAAPSKSPTTAGPTWESLLAAPEPTKLFASAASSLDLQPAHAGIYYPLDEAVIPEAFEPWYAKRKRGSPNAKPYNSDVGIPVPALPRFTAGNIDLQHEITQSRYPYLMFRETWQQLWHMVEQQNRKHAHHRVWVRGAPGAGKSIMLAATAERLRKLGWCASTSLSLP